MKGGGSDAHRVIEELARLGGGDGRGGKWRCPTPTHEDNNPSTGIFTRNRDGRTGWVCYSCGAKGDLVDLLELGGMAKRDALREAGIADNRDYQPRRTQTRRQHEQPPAPQEPDYDHFSGFTSDPYYDRWVSDDGHQEDGDDWDIPLPSDDEPHQHLQATPDPADLFAPPADPPQHQPASAASSSPAPAQTNGAGRPEKTWHGNTLASTHKSNRNGNGHYPQQGTPRSTAAGHPKQRTNGVGPSHTGNGIHRQPTHPAKLAATEADVNNHVRKMSQQRLTEDAGQQGIELWALSRRWPVAPLCEELGVHMAKRRRKVFGEWDTLFVVRHPVYDVGGRLAGWQDRMPRSALAADSSLAKWMSCQGISSQAAFLGGGLQKDETVLLVEGMSDAVSAYFLVRAAASAGLLERPMRVVGALGASQMPGVIKALSEHHLPEIWVIADSDQTGAKAMFACQQIARQTETAIRTIIPPLDVSNYLTTTLPKREPTGEELCQTWWKLTLNVSEPRRSAPAPDTSSTAVSTNGAAPEDEERPHLKVVHSPPSAATG